MTLLTSALRCLLLATTVVVAALPILALFGFAVPALDLLNHAQSLLLPALVVLGLLTILMLRRRVRNLVLTLVFCGVAASASVVAPGLVRDLTRPPVKQTHATIRLMTHNMFADQFQLASVASAILSADADILVFQEFIGDQAGQLDPILAAHYPYVVRCKGGKRANLALYSRLPFQQLDDGACPTDAYGTDRTGHILAHFRLDDGRSFAVLTTHIDWPIPIDRQAAQLAALAEVAKGIDEPLVLAGDFNSTPWTHAFRRFTRDAGLTGQTSNLLTWPARWHALDRWWTTLPVLPLDQVLTRGVTVSDVALGQPTASDHLPVVVSFSVP